MGAFIVFNLTCSIHEQFNPWVGALVGGIAGLIFSILHAVATINFHADHIISGTANIMAPPIGVFLIKALYDKGQTENIATSVTSAFRLSSIPVMPIFFKNTSLDRHYSCNFYVVAYIRRFGLPSLLWRKL